MSEALVSTVLDQLTTILFEEARQEVKLVVGVGGEIKQLKSNLESIHALLEDAEERQIKEKSIKIWLDHLKEVSYDMEDVLDEWNTALLKLQKVCRRPRPFFSCFCYGQIVQRRDIALKIKEINERLDKIDKQKARHNLAVSMNVTTRQPKREESSSFIELSKLHGRDGVARDIVSSLLSEQGEIGNVKTVSVVGMGGIGKTALAQLVYNNNEIGTHFDRKIWVCVSESFDVCKVAKEIIQCLENQEARALDGLDTLQRVLERVCKSIAGKKVFLVLDDVWTEDSKEWELMGHIFNHAACGSRILVTTRKGMVMEMIGLEASCVFYLEQLSDELCWKILSQEAFVGKGEGQRNDLVDIGREIARRCKGLPLTAKTLGCLLRTKKTREKWEEILNSELWKLHLIQKDVFVPLLFSYYDLPSAIRRCFLYCSIFPTDFDFSRDALIRLWMAQGYLSGSDHPDQLETTGLEYFECLVARSFLEGYKIDQPGYIHRWKMHDIVREFALFITGSECLSKEVTDHDSILESPERIRHLLVITLQQKSFFASKFGAKTLRSLIIFEASGTLVHSKYDQDLQQFLRGAKHLRAFDFCCRYTASRTFYEGFFKDVSELVHLRLLDFSLQPKLKTMPQGIWGLVNLQTLYLKDCPALEKIPEDIGNLVNLRFLDTTGCKAVAYYPKGIGKLTCLRELRGVKATGEVIDSEKFSLGDLERLCHLRVLAISVVGCRIDANEARRAKLQNKTQLKKLKLGLYPSVDRNEAIRVLNPPSQAELLHFIVKSKLRIF